MIEALIAATTLTMVTPEVVAARAIPKGDVLEAEDLVAEEGADLEPFLGMAVRRPLFEGKRIRLVDVEEPVAVMRQASVSILFQRGALQLQMEGRALEDGRLGETIRIAVDGRRAPLSGRVTAPGVVQVGVR